MAAAQTTRAPALVALLATLLSALLAAGETEPKGAGPTLAALARVLSHQNAFLPWRTPALPAPSATERLQVSTQCIADLSTLALSSDKMWALKMLDASTKVPDGLIFGNLVHLGNFDECLSLRAGEEGGPPKFDGQHCLVALTASLAQSNLGATEDGDGAETDSSDWRTLSLADDVFKDLVGGRAARASSVESVSVNVSVSVSLAWCAPSSCEPRDLEIIAGAAVAGAMEIAGVGVDISASVSPEQCHTPGGKALRGIDIFAICLLGLFVACALVSTVYDALTQKRGDRAALPLAFSVLSNWPKLLAVTSGRDQLSCLNGIRTISIGWVVLGHVYLISVTLPAINTLDYLPEFITSLKRIPIMNATVAVDTFFMMSGLLLSFLFLKEVEKTNHFNVIKFYVHRYVRLTPALAIVVFLTVTLLNYAGTGPLWETQQNAYSDACKENWWTNLIYVNNYVHPQNMCLDHTWYLAVDMQLYWLSPLVLIPLWKLPRRFSMMWMTFLLLLGWAVPFTIAYLMELYPGTFPDDVEKRVEAMKYYYWPAHTRYVPWLMGVLLGYVLRESRKRKPELHPLTITCSWILSIGLMIGAMISAYPFLQPDYVYERVESSFWMSLFRPTWALGLSWVIFACDQGYGGIVNRMLSWNFFQPLARLSYGVYLTHMPILMLFAGAVQSPIYLADVTAIPQFFGVLIMSVAWAIPLSLLFESPIAIIEKMIWVAGGRQRPSPGNEANEQTEEHQKNEGPQHSESLKI